MPSTFVPSFCAQPMMVGLFAAPGASRVPRSDRAWRSHAGSDAIVMILPSNM
jgi:hypothetical protein